MARPLAQKLRFWERSWSKAKARHKPKAIAIVALGEGVSAAQRLMIEVSLAFSSVPINTVFWEADRDMNNFAEEVVNASARYFITFGRNLTRGQKRVLRYLDVAFAHFERDNVDGVEAIDVAPINTTIRQLKERRNAIYMHKPEGAELGVVLRAFAQAKRMYPDLVLLMTGVSSSVIDEIGHELLVADVKATRTKLNLCDLIYDGETTWQASWVAAANVCVISGRDLALDQRIEKSLSLGAAVVVLGAPNAVSKIHDDLESKGAIWSVKRPQGLAPALAQALQPEKTALTVMQAMDYFHGDLTRLQDAIDDLVVRTL